MELIQVQNNQAVVSSRQVAEHFEKNHFHVLRDIDNIKKDVSNFGDIFFETELPDKYGRMQRAYLMNKKGFTLLSMGFTGKKALEWKLKYIDAFEMMEKKMRELENVPSYQIDDRVKRAEVWIREEKERLKLAKSNEKLLTEKNDLTEKLNEESKFRKAVFDRSDCVNYTDAAKALIPYVKNFNRTKLLSFLRGIKAIDKDNIPYAKYIKSGHFRLKEILVIPRPGHRGFIRKQGYLTQKGLDWVIKRYTRNKKAS
nr:MAG TPA: regulatory protein [Caudoviricetes sp.]